MNISHTSHTEMGQIYVGNMNIFLMVSCIILVITFGSSTALAAAYGIAVTMTMLITTILFYFVVRYSWKWSNFIALPMCGFFASVELCFFGANLLKIIHGGWFPLVVGGIIFTVMTTWHEGRRILYERMFEMITPVGDVLLKISKMRIHRNPGVAVYLAGQPQFVPSSLTWNLQHYSSLHEVILIVTVRTEEVPFLDPDKRTFVKEVGLGFYNVQLRYGFMEVPNMPEALQAIKLKDGQNVPVKKVTYFLGQEHLLAKPHGGMPIWRERLFAFMSRNSEAASKFFNLPPDQVITVGLMIEL
jgi:KUP system potassium uptake protein